MEYEGNGDTKCKWCTYYVPQQLGKKTGGIWKSVEELRQLHC